MPARSAHEFVDGDPERPALHLVTDDITPVVMLTTDVIDLSTTGPTQGELWLQRAFDVAAALIGVVLAFLPSLIIMLAVRCTSRGPVVFVQERVGVEGAPIRVYKFRTMLDGTHEAVLADAASRAAYCDNDFKLPPDDPRITAVGRFLRKTSLDELPQLLNVLCGQMSIVGVRPLLAVELALRPEHDQALYRRMRPGMTGLWQVVGRSTVRQVDRVALDRQYLENWSVWGDVKIAVRTPLALLRTGRTH